MTANVILPTWVSVWIALTIPVIFWDAGYLFMRPRSMLGGDLHWIWKPYEIYQNIDFVYGIPALESGDGFPNAQSFLNIIENFLNIFTLYLAHVRKSSAAPLVALTTASMTLAKTVLYWVQEYYCNYCAVGHNNLRDLIQYWIIPNGIWIVVPTLVVLVVGKQLLGELKYARSARAATKTQ